ncbi:Na/Pi symporter [Raineya orbicola]|jgi:sodium-dependent phosphate cotransporter|uniref:Na+/Pi-cotransporter n=1 Tax=Raineya orbicola TaxID=2016530 RepID=A0A2N3IE88_9BACT|nr:Na/Pi symporter [Raineya orbicola]PKQ68620.1 Na+/Pi-cotransporter [Raineya orbicola]
MKVLTQVSTIFHNSQMRLGQNVYRVALLLLLTLFFLFALDMAIESLRHIIGIEYLRKSLNEIYNPFIGLFVGILATALVQSSTLITSLSVALVAAGTVSISNAIPLVMGANIGTTITAMLVAFGHVGKRKEFRKAISGSLLHVLANILPTFIIFPLEYGFGFLTKLSLFFASWVSGEGKIISFEGWQFSKYVTQPILNHLPLAEYGWIFLLVSVIGVFACIRLFILLFKNWLVSDLLQKIQNVFWVTSWRAFGWGTLITAIIHSSTVVTCFLVTLIGSNKLSTRQALPFILGANLGTTLTALTASLGKTETAISIAFAHFLFNVLSVLMILPIPYLKMRFIFLSRYLGKLMMNYRLLAFAFVLIFFFLLPFVLIYLHK